MEEPTDPTARIDHQATPGPAADAPGEAINELFVSPDGDDAWSGTHPDPTADGSDGPFATLDRAQRAVRERDWTAGEPIVVTLRGGHFRRTEALRVAPEDGGTADRPVIYRAYDDEQPVIDGSRVIEGWQETEVNGVTAWKTTVDAVAAGDWQFHQLFVDGDRRRRPRLPKAVNAVLSGDERAEPGAPRFHHFDAIPEDAQDTDGARRFVPEDGTIDPDWHNLAAVEVVAMDRWYDERLPIESVDDGVVTLAPRTYPSKRWTDERYYYVENVFEALGEPGEWYLDRETGECYYIPRDGERPANVTITAPAARRLLQADGDPEAGETVDHVRFEGLAFRHGQWRHPARTGQAAKDVDAACWLDGIRHWTLAECEVRGVGEYGLAIRNGSRDVTVARCTFHDLGAGGIRMRSSRGDDPPDWGVTRDVAVVDCEIHDTGRVFHSGTGVWPLTARDVTIAHNHIHHLFYTGVSVGHDWGFNRDFITRANTIAHNHIHDIGRGLLSDMGGVYTLGYQPGTVVRDNVIERVHEQDYGGFGLYPDEGSSLITWARNVVRDAQFGLHMHYGAGNEVRNNALLDPRDAVLKYSNPDRGDVADFGFRCERNVFVWDDVPLIAAGYDWSIADGGIESDYNLLWDRGGPLSTENVDAPEWWTAWCDLENEAHSIVADPLLADPASGDYRLPADSPALAAPVNFEPIDLGRVGPRDAPSRTR